MYIIYVLFIRIHDIIYVAMAFALPYLIFENMCFSGSRQSLHIMRISKMLISYDNLDHTLYSINYGSTCSHNYHTYNNIHLYSFR